MAPRVDASDYKALGFLAWTGKRELLEIDEVSLVGDEDLYANNVKTCHFQQMYCLSVDILCVNKQEIWLVFFFFYCWQQHQSGMATEVPIWEGEGMTSHSKINGTNKSYPLKNDRMV